jgi:thymidylate synthase ThyX
MLENYESFTPEQITRLERYVTHTSSHIFVLRNLPEVIKGALFSRYSRSQLGLRALLIKDFINNTESSFDDIAGAADSGEGQLAAAAIKKAQDFYDRILDGYGDDSIGELGGAHLAIERISMLAAKCIEDCRIGGSPLEKSTRYIAFDQKEGGQYLYLREPILMTSAYRDLYLQTCDHLFDTYSRLVAPLTAHMQQKFPKQAETTEGAYKAALKAKVFDCLRGLLPASTLTNMGLYGNGRFFEGMLQKLQSHSLHELQEIGKKSFEELSKVIPSFVRRAELGHRHFKGFQRFAEAMAADLKNSAAHLLKEESNLPFKGTRLLETDPDAVYKVAAALLFDHSSHSLAELLPLCRQLSEEELARLFDSASQQRDNRRHKSPRALELAEFTFEIVADFGAYRDLQRHRLLTQRRQLLSCDLGYHIPEELSACGLEGIYCAALEKAKAAYDMIRKELPEEAQYIVPMAYNIRWYFHINLRALQWLCELRSSPAGHPSYRKVAQEMAHQVSDKVPLFERFFRFVDYEGYQLGRLGQEERREAKQAGSEPGASPGC